MHSRAEPDHVKTSCLKQMIYSPNNLSSISYLFAKKYKQCKHPFQSTKLSITVEKEYLFILQGMWIDPFLNTTDP